MPEFIEISRNLKKLGTKFRNKAGIYLGYTSKSMFKKIFEKLKIGTSKSQSSDDVNAFAESEKKKEANLK